MIEIFKHKIPVRTAPLNLKWFVPGHLRLADFGLSRRLERGGRAFTICGTIQYMGEN